MPTDTELRKWATSRGIYVAPRGRVSKAVRDAYDLEHGQQMRAAKPPAANAGTAVARPTHGDANSAMPVPAPLALNLPSGKLAAPTKTPKPEQLGAQYLTSAEFRAANLPLEDMEAWRDSAAETLEIWRARALERNYVFPVLGFVTAVIGVLLVIGKNADGGFTEEYFWTAVAIFIITVPLAAAELGRSGKYAKAAAKLTAWLATYDAEIAKVQKAMDKPSGGTTRTP